MNGQNIDIFRPEWLNVVFADRNQAYGAYQLRRDNARTTNMALLIALSGFVLLLATPTIINKLRGNVTETVTTIYKRVEIDNRTVYKIIPPKAPNKQATAAFTKPIKDLTQYRPFVATNTKPPVEPPTDATISRTDIGPVTMPGTHETGVGGPVDGLPGIATTPGSGAGASTGSTEGSGEIFHAVEVSPEYPGGEAAFGQFLRKHIRYPQVARETGLQGKAYIQFIVERDGSLTDIEIIRNPGGGIGEEAARVLKMSPHWKPGQQNGNKVRVQYTIPVNFSLGEE